MKKFTLILCSILVALNTLAQDGEPKTIVLTESERTLVEQNSDFAMNLFRKTRDTENHVISPLSITYALGMLNNGAEGITREEICQVLSGGKQTGFADVATMNAFCRKMLTESALLDEDTRVAIANTIYFNGDRKDVSLKSAFKEAAATYYDATPSILSFSDEASLGIINQWVSDKTNGMIRDLLKPQDMENPNLVSFLLNAICFKGSWVSPFDERATVNASFDDGKRTAMMMSQISEFRYAETDLYQSVILPYGNGSYQMTLFLPQKGHTLDDVLAAMNGKNWNEANYESRYVTLSMPRIETDTEQDLVEVMASMGMKNAFLKYDGHGFMDFCYLGDNEEDSDQCWISMMRQKAHLKLDEKGTEAAAATVVAVSDKIMPKAAEFIANRPFLYIISERSTGSIFFIGQYMGEPVKNKPLKPMLVQGKAWNYIYHHFEDKAEPTGDNYPEDFYNETIYEVRYYIKGDTIINGRNYVKMYRYDYLRGSKYYGAFREDEEGCVWQYDLMGDKQDFMLCDVTCSNYPGPKYMEKPDVINVNGQLLQRYHWMNLIGVEGVGIEGKGLIHYAFGEEPDCICDYESFEYVSSGGFYFTAADFRAPTYIELTKEERQLVQNNNDFAFRLFREARKSQSSNPNSQPSMLLSPLSITYALGMANNGAAGKTQQEICNVLGFGDVGAQNEFCQKMMLELLTTGWVDVTTKANIANTIFVNQGMGYQLQPDFDHVARNYYFADPQSRDFGDGKTRDVINQWASDHTKGMIQEVLSEPEFNPLAVSYLLNAIYFKGMWSSPFNVANTKEEPFDGDAPVPMMHLENVELSYAENDLYQTVVLPYGNGTYRMQVFLPQEGKTLEELLESLSSQPSLLTAHLSLYEVDLKLPRFGTSTNINLKEIMSALGMPTAFSPFEADFSKLCVDDFGENIYIGTMKQVAKIDVNEEGTEAAAVTIIGYDTTAMPDQATFHANRPFLYIISEQSTGVILFMGQYTGEVTTDLYATPNHQAEMTNDKAIYDLQGRRLGVGNPSMLKKGIYIIGGKKVIK
ncbi:MAG: serpin family protein [Prevotella sp.]|nr:serpin family protein [Prevotella sp.]